MDICNLFILFIPVYIGEREVNITKNTCCINKKMRKGYNARALE